MKYNSYLLTLFFFYCISSSAQYQLRNGHLTDWSNIGTSSEHPTYWNSIKNGATGLWSSSAQQVIYRSSDVPHNGVTYSMKLQSRSVLGIIANGAATTGAFNIGSTTATSSNNYAYSKITDSEYCSSLITFPDSISFWAKFIPSSGNSDLAKMGATIHSNAEYRDPEGSNISGQYVVGKATLNIPKTGNGVWVHYTIPFQYTGPANSPAYILVNFSTNITAGGGSSGDQLFIADLSLIYNQNLSMIQIDGINLPEFSPNIYNYDIELDHFPQITANTASSHITSLSIIQATLENPTAQISVLHGGSSKTYQVHVTLSNQISSFLTDELNISPNPSSGNITICNILDDGLSNLNVIDISGKSIMVLKNIQTSKIDIDLSRLQYGIYFIQYSNHKFYKTYKIIVNQ
jgi:hypothetical protein